MRPALIVRFRSLMMVSVAVAALGSAVVAQQKTDKPRDLDTFHLFSAPSNKADWEQRSAELRTRILFSSGLWPMPEKTPLKPRVTSRLEKDGYIVENVALETTPGFYLCGNLYRPKSGKGPFPAIANPHGHWANGRMEQQPDVAKADPKGKMGEGRGNLTAIGVNLARQGFVVFAYDMVGYNDTKQVSHDFAKGLKPWLWNVNIAGLQTWNSIRVLDYLESLPYVDKSRLGVTGASGGGSQTFLLAAVDPRVKVSVPVNMISSTMQGGCLCENGPGLRVGTDNVEIGAMAAPRPQLLVACTGDWTARVPTLEWPSLRNVYSLYDASDKTAAVQFNYQHNYNVESREAMYAWFGRWLKGEPESAAPRETPFQLHPKEMRVWTDKSPMPKDALNEPALIDALIKQSESQLTARWPKSRSGLERFREVYLPALRTSLAVDPAMPAATGRRASHGPVTLIVVDSTQAAIGEQVRELLREKGQQSTVLRLEPITIKPDQLWNNFFTGYNRTPLGDRVNQVSEAMETLLVEGYSRVDLVGMGKAGVISLFARATSGLPGKTAVDAGQFAEGDDQAYIDGLYAPGLRRAGDLRAAAMLCAPDALCLFNTGTQGYTAAVSSGFAACKAPIKLETGAMQPAGVVTWLAGK